MNGRLIPAVVVCLAWGAPAFAQRLAYLYGRILDPSEAAVAGASITVVSEDTGFRRFAESQPDGEYTIGSLQPGVYKITVRKEGFRTIVEPENGGALIYPRGDVSARPSGHMPKGGYFFDAVIRQQPDQLENFDAADNTEQFTLLTDKPNESRKFYSKHGFVESGMIPMRYLFPNAS